MSPEELFQKLFVFGQSSSFLVEKVNAQRKSWQLSMVFFVLPFYFPDSIGSCDTVANESEQACTLLALQTTAAQSI